MTNTPHYGSTLRFNAMKITSRLFHRWLSVVIGVQLLLWTVSGLIFSWNPIKQVRGEHRIQDQEPLDLSAFELLDSRSLLTDPNLIPADASVSEYKLRQLLDRPVLELTLQNSETSHVLVDAVSGERLSPISRELAEAIALSDFSEPAAVIRSELLDQPESGHSEYRSKETPAWKVELDHSSGTVIYVSANRGRVVTRRNNRWRLFDFFWMLHTMDYEGRDNFNSWLLRIISSLGVLSVLTGYWLWLKTGKKRPRKTKGPAAPNSSL
jgi:uncharacterized iron-regulated membrane protein